MMFSAFTSVNDVADSMTPPFPETGFAEHPSGERAQIGTYSAPFAQKTSNKRDLSHLQHQFDDRSKCSHDVHKNERSVLNREQSHGWTGTA
jgi:hypothetical protein